jgi:hypothetical protein
VNGYFESGLSNWTWSQVNEPGATGTYSYNAARAPGSETLTSTEGFPATHVAQIVLGSVASTPGVGLRSDCTLCQDIAIPSGTGNLTLRFDVGVEAGNDDCGHVRAIVGLQPASAVPTLTNSPL